MKIGPAVIVAIVATQVIAAAPVLAKRAPATTPSTQPASSPAFGFTGVVVQDGRLLINFHEAPIIVVIDELATATGMTVVKKTLLRGTVTIVSQQPVSLEGTIKLLTAILKNAGYDTIRHDNVLKIVAPYFSRRDTDPDRRDDDVLFPPVNQNSNSNSHDTARRNPGHRRTP